MIISDLDGTFLDSNSKLVQRNIDAIEYFKLNGGRFTFATGRNEQTLELLLPQTEDIINAPAILTNGSYIYDFQNKKRIDEVFLPFETSVALINNVVSHFPDIGIRISTPYGFLCPNLSSKLKKDIWFYKDITVFTTVNELRKGSWNKIVFVDEPDKINEVYKYVKTLDLKDFNVTATSPVLLEILDKNATKGIKVKSLKNLNGHTFTVYGVGDYENDFELLKAADYAACPKNAIDSIKKISDFILCDNNCGTIADLIKLIENNLSTEEK